MFYRDVNRKRKYVFQSIKHGIVFRVGILPFVRRKGAQYAGVMEYWKERNIARVYK